MSATVLIIEHSASPIVSGVLTPGQHEHRSWDELVPESLLQSRVKLVLAHAVPGTAKVTSFFKWLLQHPIHIPTLAVLPEFADPAWLQTVSGAVDEFVFCPLRGPELELRMERMLGAQAATEGSAHQTLQSSMGLTNLVGRHASFLEAVRQVSVFAASDAPVLITGETGTGKELFAHAIHSLSQRRSGPFIPVDCGSLPEQLAENELFGHCRGAFTDAHSDQKGLAGMAHGGTLFLDEIDALSTANQAKLLRFLQEGTYRSLGADRFSRSNARIIAATNRKIEDCVSQRLFRGDLYFRLNVLRLPLPPLRDRRGDVSLLARHFLGNEGAGRGNQGRFFSPAALRKLESYHWPGNARELFNSIQRASVCAPGRQITAEDIVLSGSMNQTEFGSSGESFRAAKQNAIEQFERTYVEALLARHQGNITHAAREAGKERRAFGRLAKKYGAKIL